MQTQQSWTGECSTNTHHLVGMTPLVALACKALRANFACCKGCSFLIPCYVWLLQYYADDAPQDDPDDFDANRAALGLRARPSKVHAHSLFKLLLWYPHIITFVVPTYHHFCGTHISHMLSFLWYPHSSTFMVLMHSSLCGPSLSCLSSVQLSLRRSPRSMLCQLSCSL